MSGRVAFWFAAEGPGVARALGEDRARLEARAARRLSRLLARSVRVPLYAPLLAGSEARSRRAPFEVLRGLPAADKPTLRAAGLGCLLDGAVDPAWRSTRSSGTTGEPFRVYYEPRAWAILKHLVKIRARWACGVRPGQRIAVVDVLPEGLTAAAPEAAAAGPLLPRRVSALAPAERIAAALEAFRPAVLYGLPSALLEAGRRAGACVRPRIVFTSGELLTPGLRAGLRGAYGAPVRDIYGTTETKEIAWECPEGGLHLNADVLHVEVLDRDGEPLREGEEGELAVTVLVNAAMPLLRYKTGDRGALGSGPCRCGVALPLLQVVSGREAEYLDLGDGCRLSPYRLTMAVEAVPGIGRFQVTQRKRRVLAVRAVPLGGTDPEALRRRIAEAVVSAVPVPVGVEVALEAAMNSVGKFRVVRPMAPAG